MKHIFAQVEYQIIIKTKGNRSTMQFRTMGKPLYISDLSFNEKKLIYRDLYSMTKEFKKIYIKGCIRNTNSKIKKFWYKLKERII